MTNNNYKNYLCDLVFLLKEKAVEAKLEKEISVGGPNADYKLGYLMAFHDVISLMKQQAEAFEIDQIQIDLQDIEPESDLL
jgi:hypothetical protein